MILVHLMNTQVIFFVLTGVRANTVQLTKNARTIVETINCNDGDEDLRDCLPDNLDDIDRRSQVAGLICSTSTAYTDVKVKS